MKYGYFNGKRYPVLLEHDYLDPRYNELVDRNEYVTLYRDVPTGVLFLFAPKHMYELIADEIDSSDKEDIINAMAIADCHSNPRQYSCKGCGFRNDCNNIRMATKLYYLTELGYFDNYKKTDK